MVIQTTRVSLGRHHTVDAVIDEKSFVNVIDMRPLYHVDKNVHIFILMKFSAPAA